MMIIAEGYITGLLTNYYEYADNIRNLPVKELMRRQGEKLFQGDRFTNRRWESLLFFRSFHFRRRNIGKPCRKSMI